MAQRPTDWRRDNFGAFERGSLALARGTNACSDRTVRALGAAQCEHFASNSLESLQSPTEGRSTTTDYGARSPSTESSEVGGSFSLARLLQTVSEPLCPSDRLNHYQSCDEFSNRSSSAVSCHSDNCLKHRSIQPCCKTYTLRHLVLVPAQHLLKPHVVHKYSDTHALATSNSHPYFIVVTFRYDLG
jgi:hypothetical protein